MVRKTFYCLLLAAALVCVCALNTADRAAETAFLEGRPVFVIDAGHGGIDGGAVSKSGLLEKDVNLSVAIKCSYLLNLLGADTLMTRESDASIDDGSGATIAARKAADIRRRVEIANGSAGALISIHMNSFPDGKYWGAQCFYAKTEGSRALGEAIQESLRQLNTENVRQAKQADGEIYLLKHAKLPALIVECGFLSNEAEAERLASEAYRVKLALAISAGAIEGVKSPG